MLTNQKSYSRKGGWKEGNINDEVEGRMNKEY